MATGRWWSWTPTARWRGWRESTSSPVRWPPATEAPRSTREWPDGSSVRQRGPRHPELRRRRRQVRARQRVFLLALVHAALGRHLRPSPGPAHRADADRGWDWLRDRLRAGPARLPGARAGVTDRGHLELPLHDPQPGPVPDPRAVHRADAPHGRNRSRLLHAAVVV